jgi:hypothetical protein
MTVSSSTVSLYILWSIVFFLTPRALADCGNSMQTVNLDGTEEDGMDECTYFSS